MTNRTSNIQTLWLSLSGAKSTIEFDKRFAVLFERLKVPLEYFFTVKCGRSPHDAQDLVMETMRRVLEKMHLYDSEGGMFSTWVFSIARNILIDNMRRNRVQNAMCSIDAPMTIGDDDDVPILSLEDGTPLPDELLNKKELHAHLHKCIEKLPPQTKQAVMLFYFDQIKLVEIAEAMNIGLNNVKTLLFRARHKLAEIY